MDRSGLFIKTAAICSSLLLATGFVLYRAGVFDRLFLPDDTFSTELRAAESFSPSRPDLPFPDTPRIETLSEQDSAYLERQAGRALFQLLYGSPERLMRLQERLNLMSELAELEKRQLHLMYSSKSAPILYRSEAYKIDSLKRLLLANLQAETLVKEKGTTPEPSNERRFMSGSKSLAPLIELSPTDSSRNDTLTRGDKE